MIRKGRIAAVLVLAACLLVSAAAAGMLTEVDNPALEMSLQLGYDGAITYGKAFPARVTIRNNGEDFEGYLGINAYVTAKTYDRYETEIILPAGAEREYTLAPVTWMRQDVFTAEITRDGEVVCAVNAEPEKVINPSALLIGVLSTRPQNLNNLIIDRENDVLGRYEMWQTIPLTKETFPDDPRLMNSFGMIVMDDIDPAELSGKQQEALNRWLRNGRILLCGGGAAGARAVSWFSGDTGLRMEGMDTSADVLRALQRSVGRAETAESIPVSLAVLTGAEPLVRDGEGRGLIWRSTAGGGRIYTSAFEAGDAALNADKLMHYYWQQLLVNNDPDHYNTVLYSGGEDQNDAAVFAGWSAQVRVRTGMLPAVLIAAAMPAAAALCWLVLKKTGKQKWMLAALPLLSAAAVAVLAVLSGASEAKLPMAVIAENLVQDADGNIRSYRGIAAAAPAYGRHSYSTRGENLRVRSYDYVEFDEEETEKKREPSVLRTSYIAGGESSLTAESSEPWEIINMTCDAEGVTGGRVEASLWMEEDGLHAEIVNGTAYRLTAGHVITNCGYASVPDLAPGEKAEASLVHRQMADPANPVYEDGGLYLNEGTDFYSMACAALGYTETYDGSAERSRTATQVSMISGAASQLVRQKTGTGYTSAGNMQFVYSAVPEGLPETGLQVDGKPVGKTSILGQLTAEVARLEIGRTGIVFRPAGTDTAVRVETDGNGMPGQDAPMSQQRTSYHALSEHPTFRFDLSGLRDVQIEKLRLVMESYYTGQAKAFALNAKAGAWEEIRMNENIPDPGNYLSETGMLYLQFRPDTQEMYAEVPTPTITIEGRAAVDRQ